MWTLFFRRNQNQCQTWPIRWLHNNEDDGTVDGDGDDSDNVYDDNDNDHNDNDYDDNDYDYDDNYDDDDDDDSDEEDDDDDYVFNLTGNPHIG